MQAADSVEVDQAGAGAGAGARDLDRALTDGLHVEAEPRMCFLQAAAAGSWKRPDHGRSGSGS